MKISFSSLIHKKNVFETCYPFLLVFHFFGLTVFDIKSVKFQSSTSGIFFFIVSNAYNFSLSVSMILNPSESISHSKILKIGMQLGVFVPQIMIALVLIQNFAQRRKLHGIYLKIYKIDAKVITKLLRSSFCLMLSF